MFNTASESQRAVFSKGLQLQNQAREKNPSSMCKLISTRQVAGGLFWATANIVMMSFALA